MSGVSNQSSPTTSPLPTRSATGEVSPQPVPTPTPDPSRPRRTGEEDQLRTRPGLVPVTPDHSTLAQRVKALREQGDAHPVWDGLHETYTQTTAPAMHNMRVEVRQAMATPQAKRAEKNAARAGGFLAFVGNALNGLVASPKAIVGNIQGLLYGGHAIVDKANDVKGFASALNAARKDGKAFNFVRGQFQSLRAATGSALARTFGQIKSQKAMFFLQRIAGRNVSQAANAVSENKGLFGFYQAARAGGAGPIRAFSSAFGRTVETGGNMPTVIEDAAQLGGRWGKTLAWAGRIGRVAPLLNVPLAAFDIKCAIDVWSNPRATTQQKVEKTGTAALTTAAAGLAVAGFLTPPPVDAALFMAAGIAGIASGVWSFFASGTASKVAHSVGHFFSSAAHKVGHFFSGAAHFFGL
jgi:hypothetical protein